MSLGKELYVPQEHVLVWAGAVGGNINIRQTYPLYGGTAGTGQPCRRIIIITPGTLVLTAIDGTVITLPTLPAGFVLDGAFANITAAGSSAYDLLLQW